jgi:hypothetical protein
VHFSSRSGGVGDDIVLGKGILPDGEELGLSVGAYGSVTPFFVNNEGRGEVLPGFIFPGKVMMAGTYGIITVLSLRGENGPGETFSLEGLGWFGRNIS